MSSKIPTLLVVVLVINAMMLWWTAALTQSAELLDAIKTAEKQQEQGKLTEAFKTLTAVKPTNSEESSRKDKSLQELVKAFLGTRQSERAVITAQRIGSPELRNNVLLDILRRQCYAVTYKPEEFDLMIGKAEKTVLLLTDHWQDDGYGEIALAYAYSLKFDLAVETLKKMKDAERRDYYLLQREHPHFRHLFVFASHAGIPEMEIFLLDLVNLVQSPVMKAKAMLYLANFYNQLEYRKIDEDNSRQKRLETLREATELLRPLPSEPQKVEMLLETYRHYTYHDYSVLGPEAEEVENARKAVFESILSIKDSKELFGCYGSLFTIDRIDRVHPVPDTDFIKAIELIAENASNPKDRANHWKVHLVAATVRGWILPGSDEQVKAFHRAYNAASQIDEPLERAVSLWELVRFASPERTEALLNEIVDLILSSEDEAVARSYNRFRWFETVVVGAAKLHNTEWVLGVIHSPQVPDAWKPELYRRVLMSLYWEAHSKYHGETNDEILKAAKEIDWSRWIESALTITDSLPRFETCRSLAGTLCVRKIDVDVAPLLDEMLQIAETEKDMKMFYQMREIAQRYSLWYSLWHENEWFRQCEAIDAERAPEQFQRLRQYHDLYSSSPEQSEYGKNFKINQFLEAARAISVSNPCARLDAFWETARQADSEGLPDRAREVLDEAIAYAELFPKETRLTLRAEDQLMKVRKLREELQGR